MADLDAIVGYAKKHPAARADRIGITGFCRGGMYTLLYAAHNQELKAAVAWYGAINPEKSPGIREVGPLDVVSRINAPVLGLYGEADLGIPMADVKEMEAPLKAAGRMAEFVLYPGAPHASLRTTDQVTGPTPRKTPGVVVWRGSTNISRDRQGDNEKSP